MVFKKIFFPTTLGILVLVCLSDTARAFDFSSEIVSTYTLHSYKNGAMAVSAEGDGERAKATIDKMGQNAISFLSDDSLSIDGKAEKFRQLLHTNFDMETLGRFALGSYWKTATDAQKKEYQKLFENLIVKVYSARFNDYEGQKFDVTSFQDTGKKDITVTTYIVPDTGSKVQVDWRLRDRSGQFKVVDVVIEGVSMAVTQRSDFASVIQRGGGNVDVLLDHLRN